MVLEAWSEEETQMSKFWSARTGMLLASIFTLCAAVLATAETAVACPFCGAASLTLSEQLQGADAAVLVQWVSGKKPEKESAGSTTYEIVRAVKPVTLTKGKRIDLDRYRAGKAGDLFLLLGTKGDGIEWGSPFEVTETSFNYITQAPSPESPPQKRLAYFLKFLEYSDPMIGNDAYGEFGNAPYKDVAALAKELPREKLRKWITSPDVQQSRMGLYGMMLGLCGDESDAELLKSKIVLQSEDLRLGIDGIMAGYLLLTGEKGLAVIEESKLANKKVPFSETFAAMQALRFLWSYGDGRIAPERLRQSMRILLDRPELADLVIADLARWKDWSVQKRLLEMYGSEEFNIPSHKRAIVRYMLASTKDVAEAEGEAVPQHALDGQKYLNELRAKDPKTVAEAERFFIYP
jgi:hypothetical protein